MYFINEEERLYLNKSLIPKSREMYIDKDLRGWNWQRPPMEAIYDIKLAVYEVANNYCPSNRDLYLRRVLGIKTSPNRQMIEGSILHNAIFHFITESKKTIYNNAIEELINSEIFELSENILKKITKNNNNDIQIKDKVNKIWNFEKQKLLYRIQDVLSRQPYIGVDALLYQVIPVVVEHKLNGSFLGLSPYLSTDALNFSEPMIADIKFGERKDFHKLSVTGYALVMEAIHSFPVNLGFVTYPKLKNERILLDRDFFIIDDELRQKFIENRDDKMRMIYEENDPGNAVDCYKSCPYYHECR